MIYSSEWKYMPIISTLRLIYQESQSTNSIKLFISILPYPGKSQFSFQSQRKAMPKNVQTTTKLHSSHTLAKSCWKFSKPGFNSMWTVNFLQAGFRKGRGTRDQIANIPWIIEKAREFQKNIYFCFIGYAKAFDYVDHNKLWIILQEMGIPDHLIYLLRNLYASKEGTVRTGHGTMNWFQIGKVQFSSITQSCLNFCDPVNSSTPGFPVHHQLPELAQTHVHQVGDAIQLSHPFCPLLLPSIFPSIRVFFNAVSDVSSSHQVAKVLELQLQHQSFQWTFRTDFL